MHTLQGSATGFEFESDETLHIFNHFGLTDFLSAGRRTEGAGSVDVTTGSGVGSGSSVFADSSRIGVMYFKERIPSFRKGPDLAASGISPAYMSNVTTQLRLSNQFWCTL